MNQSRSTSTLAKSPPVPCSSHSRTRAALLALLLIAPSLSFPAEKDSGKPPISIKGLARELRSVGGLEDFKLHRPLYSAPHGVQTGSMRLSGRTVSKSETTVRRNLVTVNGYFGKKFATDIPSGCSARVNGVQVYPKQREIVLRVRAKLTLLRPEIVRVVRRSLSPEAEQWAEEFLRKDEIKISCRPGKGGRAEVF